MSTLVRVELRRLFSRRISFFAALAAVALTGLVIFGTASDAKPLSGQELAMTRQGFQEAQQEWQQHGPEMIKDCLKEQARERESDPSVDFDCDQQEPRWENFGKPAPSLDSALPEALKFVSTGLAFIGFLLGAAFLAAEFTTGAMANWLTFEPRRMRVYASRAAAAGLGVVLPSAVLVAAVTAGVWVICHAWGSTALPDGPGPVALMALRVVVLTTAATIAGAALGSLVRHTAAAIGVVMAYLVLVEGMFAGSLLQYRQSWLLLKNVEAWVAHGASYFVNDCKATPTGDYVCTTVERHLSFAHGTAYLTIACGLIVLVGAVLFQRRDVV